MIMLVKAVLACAALCYCVARAQEAEVWYREVDISGQGRVKGYRTPGTGVFTFYGIPYATAPTGKDKFKAPLPARTWNDTLEATDQRIVCPQNTLFDTTNFNVIDDCLIANIFVPDTEETNLSVLILIHGGGFQVGYGNDMSFTSLVNTKKVVAVSFNYRLGISGFLCLGNEHAPGNAGMKDQVALLRWVRDNISAFGGNPNDVTVSGCSAGGSSVSLLMLSKLTDGLMHKVMPESGPSIGSLSVQFDPLQNAKDHALRLNFTNVDDIEALTDFYTSMTDDILLQDFGYLFRKDSTVVFTTCVETDIGQERFLEEAPIDILRNKNYKIIPMLVGFANLEGAWRYNMFYEWKDLMNERFSDFLPADLEFKDESERDQMAVTLKDFYFHNETVNNGTLLSFINYFSDVLFIQSTLFSVRLLVQGGNNQLYLHEYSFNRIDRPAVPGRDFEGATHCAQTITVADEGDESFLLEDYKAMKAIMRELWLDFIVHGNPTPPDRNNTLPTWPPTGADNSPHYSLGQVVQVRGVPAEDRTLFWDAIYEKHFRTPRAPSAAHISTISKSLFGTIVGLISFFFIRS